MFVLKQLRIIKMIMDGNQLKRDYSGIIKRHHQQQYSLIEVFHYEFLNKILPLFE